MTRRRRAWVALGAAAACLILAMEARIAWPAAKLVLNTRRSGRIYYLPSESMLPTLAVNDRVVPMRVDGPLRRGEVIVFEGPQGARVARVAGLPGDRIAVRRGVVEVDGATALVRMVSSGPILDEGTRTKVLAEEFSGEAHPHLILEAGQGPGDAFGPQIVPAGKLFVLGDNRDRAADSRFAVDEGGVGMVSIDRVIGAVEATLWSSRTKKLGTPIDALDPATAKRRS